MDIFLRKVLKGHMSIVLAVDFDDRYIVSGSADNTIKVCVGEGRREREGGEGGRGGEAEGGGGEACTHYHHGLTFSSL